MRKLREDGDTEPVGIAASQISSELHLLHVHLVGSGVCAIFSVTSFACQFHAQEAALPGQGV